MTVKLIFAVVLATVAWGAMFAPGRRGFWTRAALSSVAIATYALFVDFGAIGRLFDRHHGWADAGVGLASGLVLYLVFWLGEQFLVLLLPRLAREVGDLYRVRGETRPRYVPLVLLLAAPAEELFFRGLLQARAGVAVALAVYGAVHLWERKVILVAAALVGGAFWGALLAWTGGLIAPVLSHLVWAMAIIVWRPVGPAAWAERAGDRLRASRRRRPRPAR